MSRNMSSEAIGPGLASVDDDSSGADLTRMMCSDTSLSVNVRTGYGTHAGSKLSREGIVPGRKAKIWQGRVTKIWSKVRGTAIGELASFVNASNAEGRSHPSSIDRTFLEAAESR